MTPEELNALRTFERLIYRMMQRHREKYEGEREVIREHLFRVRHEIAEAERAEDDVAE